MNRIKKTFDKLNRENKKALGIFVTAGDPNFESSLKLIANLPNNGADFIEIGMFDDSFPMYCEDVDLSLRFKEIGKKIFYVPDSKVWHKVSYSIGGEFSINKWKIKQLAKFKLINKHSNSLIMILMFPLLVLLSLIEFNINDSILSFPN